MPEIPIITNLAAAWPKRASIYRDPSEFKAWQSEIAVMGSIANSLAGHSAAIAAISSPTTTVIESGGGGTGGGAITFSAPSQFSVSGSPVSLGSSLTLSWNTQSAAFVLAGPISGGSSAPGFRALVASDIPSLSYVSSTATQSAHTALMGPSSGGAAAPSFRTIGISDLPGFYSNDISANMVHGAVPYVDSGGNLALLAPAGSSGQSLVSQGAGADVEWAQLVNTIVGTANEVNVSNVGGVFTLSTPQAIASSSSPTFNSLVLANPLGVADGGSGLASTSQSFVFIGPTSGSGAPSWRALVAGDIPSLSYVSSVGLSLPSIFSVSGSPVTSSGTLSGALVAQSANAVWAGPSSGSTAAPSFRSLVAADIPALGYVSSVGLSAPSQFSVSGSPVTSSGSLAFSWANQSANVGLFGPSSGSAGAPGFRALVLADLPSPYSSIGSSLAQGSVVYVNSAGQLAVLAPGASGQFLQTGGSSANPTWASGGSGSPGGSNTEVQFNSSGSFAGDAGFTYGGSGGSTLVGLTPASTSATVIGGTAPSGFKGNFFEFLDSSGAITVQLYNSPAGNGSTGLRLLSQTGSSSPAAVGVGLNGYQAMSGSEIGGFSYLEAISGTAVTVAALLAVAAENQSSGHQGTDLYWYVTPTGSGTVQHQGTLSANGNFIPNATGSALSTSSTNGFIYVPNTAGVPTGTPAAYTGATPQVFDSSDSVLMFYNGSSWVDASGGVVTTISGTGNTLKAATKLVVVNLSGVQATCTLPAASSYVGREMIFRVGPTAAASFKCTISAASGDTVYDSSGTGVSPTLGSGGTYAKYLRLMATTSGVWATVGGA